MISILRLPRILFKLRNGAVIIDVGDVISVLVPDLPRIRPIEVFVSKNPHAMVISPSRVVGHGHDLRLAAAV